MTKLTEAEQAGYTKAREYTRNAVHSLVRDLGGEVVMRPIGGGLSSSLPEPADALAGIHAALRVEAYAHQLAIEYVRRARGEGVSWADLAPVLDVPAEEDDKGGAAFEITVPVDPAHPWDRRTTFWRCSTCDQLVTDNGPYESHPADCETGHADNCTRQAADIRDWRRRTGWED